MCPPDECKSNMHASLSSVKLYINLRILTAVWFWACSAQWVCRTAVAKNEALMEVRLKTSTAGEPKYQNNELKDTNMLRAERNCRVRG